MSHLAQVSAIVGALLPLLLSVVNQTKWSSSTKSIVAFAACFLSAVVVTLVEGHFDTHDMITSMVAVYTLAMVTYHGFWKPTNVSSTIEVKTDLGTTPA